MAKKTTTQMNRGLAGCLGCLGTLMVIGMLSEASASGSSAAAVVIWLLVIGSVVGGLIQWSRKKPCYALEIETSGSPFTVVVSTDKERLDILVRQIMDAIDNPEAEFQMQVENLHVGDSISMTGSHNTGKRG